MVKKRGKGGLFGDDDLMTIIMSAQSALAFCGEAGKSQEPVKRKVAASQILIQCMWCLYAR